LCFSTLFNNSNSFFIYYNLQLCYSFGSFIFYFLL
jgi:hypothetical protein